MKVKHVLMIAAVLLAMLVMPVVAADESGPIHVITQDSTEIEKEVYSTVTNTIPSTYIVTIPQDIPFDRGAEIKATEVLLKETEVLSVTVDSNNDWNLTLDNSADRLKYTMSVSGIEVNDGYKVLNVVLPLTQDTATLTFKTEDKAKKAGDYTDTLTFRVSLSSSSSGTAPVAKEFVIDNLEELKSFRDLVNDGNHFTGWTVKLAADIDLNNEEWKPIGSEIYSNEPFHPEQATKPSYYYTKSFWGTFDGQDHTISNLKITSNADNVGLFGWFDGQEANGKIKPITPVIKNLNIENVQISGGKAVGTLVGNVGNYASISDCTVSGTIDITGSKYVGGLIGYTYSPISDSTVKSTGTIHATEKRAGGIVGYFAEGGKSIKTLANCKVEGVTIKSPEAVGGIGGTILRNNVVTGCSINDVILVSDTTVAAEENNYVYGYTTTDIDETNGHVKIELNGNTHSDVTVEKYTTV